MDSNRTRVLALALGVALGTAIGGCAKKEEAKATAAPTAAPSASLKIPVTTSSEAARAEFLQGRDMAEKLRITDFTDRSDVRQEFRADPGRWQANFGQVQKLQRALNGG